MSCSGGTTTVSSTRERMIELTDVRQPIVLAPPEGTPCNGAVVWLHGFGGCADGWAPLFCKIAAKSAWRWVLPNAPSLPQPCYGGRRIPGWGEFLDEGCVRCGSLDYNNPDGAGHYAAACAYVHEIIDGLGSDHGIPPDRIVVGGFSQGAAVALQAALCATRKLAGCIVFSGWLLPG